MSPEAGGVTRSILCLMMGHSYSELEPFRRRHIHSPGRDIPFHITMLYTFLQPSALNGDIIDRLRRVAADTAAFPLSGKPLSSFPTSRVLYLTPAPAAPLESLYERLLLALPELSAAHKAPVFHLTLAYEYGEQEQSGIIAEYFRHFGKAPITLRADRLSIYTEQEGQWTEHLSFALGH